MNVRKHISTGFASLLLAFFALSTTASALSVSAPTTQFKLMAASCDLTPGDGGLSTELFTPWYKYLPGDDSSGKCRVAIPDDYEPARVAALVLVAVIELITRLASLVAVGFVIFGAVQYVTSQGDSQGLSNAKSTIANALIGLVITLLAVALVQFLARAYAGTP